VIWPDRSELMVVSITAGMIVPAFTSYEETGLHTVARRYSGGRLLIVGSSRVRDDGGDVVTEGGVLELCA
jgi:hypothetical protein